MGAAERAVMDGLFSDAGLADPAAVLASAGISGCRYAFVDAVLRTRGSWLRSCHRPMTSCSG